MSSNAIAKRYAFALDLIREAGTHAASFLADRDGLTITAKGVQDMASEADLSTERLIRSRIEAAFPEDAFLGEESGASEIAPGQGIWVVDPIDGTQPYVSGLSTWCVSIGYVQNGKVEFGTVYAPARDQMFAGGKAFPATLNGKPVGRNPSRTIANGLVEVGYSARTDLAVFLPLLTEFLKRDGIFTRGGSGALGLCYVAAGWLVGYVELHINSWDCVGAIGVLDGAGLKTSNFLAGNGLRNGNPLIAGNESIYAELEDLCRKCGIAIPA